MVETCPFCGADLYKVLGIRITEKGQMTFKEFWQSKEQEIRYDCDTCKCAFLLFKPTHFYFWHFEERPNGIRTGIEETWTKRWFKVKVLLH